MNAVEISEVMARQQASGDLYLEFLRVPSLSVGLYALPAGSRDPQTPHGEDEVYYIISGRGFIRVGSEDREVQPGSVVFVAAAVEHRFHTISEELRVLVFFAPAQGA